MVIKSSFYNPRPLKLFSDNYKDLPITIFFDYIPQDIEELQINPYNIFIAHEPSEFFGIQGWVAANYRVFDAVLSWNHELLSKCLNGIPLRCGWVYSWEPFTPVDVKKFEVSFLSGVKALTYGHQLRQFIFSLEDKITIPKKWYKFLDDFDVTNNVRPGYTEYSKDLSHIPWDINPEVYGKQFLFESMFHIAIENVKKPYWYTEKVSQAFFNKSIPIYWGCPNLEEMGYDLRGVIQFGSPEELLYLVNSLKEEDYYDRLPYIEHNYEVAKNDTLKNKLSYFIEQLKILNNL